jgi:hypothetical protein
MSVVLGPTFRRAVAAWPAPPASKGYWPGGSLGALGPDQTLVGPDDAPVVAETEGVADGVGVDAKAVAVGAGGVPLQGRSEGQDTALFRLDVVDFEVEMELFGVLAVGPLRGSVVLHPDEGQLNLAELDTGPILVAAPP